MNGNVALASTDLRIPRDAQLLSSSCRYCRLQARLRLTILPIQIAVGMACPEGRGVVRWRLRDFAELYFYAATRKARKSQAPERWLFIKLAPIDEKDLPAAQSPPQTNARISSPDGLARRPGRFEAPPRQGAQAPDPNDSTQTAGLNRSHAAMSFGAADRLHRSAEFLRLQRRGLRVAAKHFVLYAGRSDSDDPARKRLGITVSRRIGNAVVRNRVKRRVRECFRLILRERLDDGMSMLVIALAGAGNLGQTAINSELLTATLNLAGKRPR